MTRISKKQRHSKSMSDALRLYRLRTKAMKEELEIDADVESESEVDNGLSAFDEWENQIITLSDDNCDNLKLHTIIDEFTEHRKKK